MTPGSQHPKDKRCFAYDRCKKVPDTFECSMCSNPVDCECRAGDYNPGMINDKEKIKILEANIRKKDNDIAVLTDMISSHPAAGEQEMKIPYPNSTDLLLIAHDEWKRREERHHRHENIPWVAGWISGFLTSRKFARDRIVELRRQPPSQQGGRK